MESIAEYDRRVMSLVAAARERPAGERHALLDSLRETEPALYEEVLDALNWEERMGGFLQQPMAALLNLARPFTPGQVIADRFEITQEIGEGGMGFVYAAFDRRRQQRIAIKAAKPGFQTLLSPELEGALKVRHPNICLVNEIHTAHTASGDVDFITMEFLEGETLTAHLGKLSRKDVLLIARQLCAGVAEAHRSGIIHRDLKAGNIIVCRAENGELRAVITDFGLAGAAAADGADFAGTPAYMAPELWQGTRTSQASDIYALGVILSELFGTDPPPVIKRCLREDPEARPKDALQIITALEQKRFLKFSLVTCAIGLAVLGALQFWPQPANVRLAVLPLSGPVAEASLPIGIQQDVADRVARLQRGDRRVVVIRPHETQSYHVQTPEQAKHILHATHALQIAMRRDGSDWIMDAAVIDLSTQVNVGKLSGRYSTATVGNMPVALAGTVSLALKLRGDSASESLSADATVPYDQGLYFLRKDNPDLASAIALFESAARLDPHSPLPLAALTEAHILTFKETTHAASLEKAHASLRAAESLNPDFVAVRLAAGLLHETDGEYEKALDDYQRVRDLDERSLEARLRSASVYDALDMPDRAIDAHRKAIALEPEYYKPYHAFGVFYYYRGRYREAAEQFQKAIARAPGRADEYTNLAAAYSDLWQDSKAEQALLTSLGIHESANARNSLGAIRAYQRRDREAILEYRRAVALDATDYVYWLNLGDSARRLDFSLEASTAYDHALRLARSELAQNPRLGLVRAYVAYFEARRGRRDMAEDRIGEALKFSPGDSKVMRRAVLTYETLGERDRAIETLRTAGPELLHELERHPDLDALARDVRFQQLVAANSTGEK